MKLKLSSSYDKLALTLAVLGAAGLGSSIYVDAGKVERDFRDAPALSGPHGHPPARLPSLAELGSDESSPRTFTGEPLFVNADGVAFDLADPDSDPVHPPIPNIWWLKYGIDPGYSDSPQRDADRDGFSNLEEFLAKTNPIEADEHPPLLEKLRVAKLEKVSLRLSYVTDDCVGEPGPANRYGFRYEDTKKRKHNEKGLQPGKGAASLMFAKAPAQHRFEFKAIRREHGLDPRVNLQRPILIATVVDRSPHKQGREYEIKKGSRNGIIIRDFIATLFLDVPGQAAQRFVLPENTRFSLPFDEGAAEKPHRFVEAREGKDGLLLVIESVREGKSVRRLLPAPR